jgi:hypothetical protein
MRHLHWTNFASSIALVLLLLTAIIATAAVHP